jgi:hypothetical protein
MSTASEIRLLSSDAPKWLMRIPAVVAAILLSRMDIPDGFLCMPLIVYCGLTFWQVPIVERPPTELPGNARHHSVIPGV